MRRREVIKGLGAAGAAAVFAPRVALAQDVIKIGACLSLVGGFQTVGRQALVLTAAALDGRPQLAGPGLPGEGLVRSLHLPQQRGVALDDGPP